MSAVMLLSIAVDRFICIGFPTVYQNMSRAYTMTSGIVAALLFASTVSIETYLTNPRDIDSTCGLFEGLPHKYDKQYFAANLFICLVTLFLYLVMWTYVKNKSHTKSQKVLIAVTSTTLCICTGWLISIGLAVKGNNNTVPRYSMILFHGLPINVSMALSYPLLYIFSRDYRNAFQEQIRIVTCHVGHKFNGVFNSSVDVFRP
ncbi:unnamed protein product [Bursaphelenchus okinawaensis]|uniref:G-protein coupled receptors family 1 profile domain-containing protein n=1 Tax=Bursaphelenchus okinawaensis TaxID=465554 RepID=A0A811LA36_9BILA|nr:unnamed protein product [Bursaphelenchus okinawaensis]CAG9119417.1 unnamed protein product [Bursaphelenchus okinawaensis]